jgi:hypothetical protein
LPAGIDKQGINVSDQQKVADRAGVCGPHASEPGPLQRFDVPADVFGYDILQDAVRLEESIELVPGLETEKAPQLGLGDGRS